MERWKFCARSNVADLSLGDDSLETDDGLDVFRFKRSSAGNCFNIDEWREAGIQSFEALLICMGGVRVISDWVSSFGHYNVGFLLSFSYLHQPRL